ncbi:hypothetical protein [Catenulispora pinisilvae]|uniref:hypothetical protein n=1 Tax=Catenulispora pinisilvae TaxID=2705253 RepID=UPI001E412BCF|nr:hypothetical protein [Catenulispora pinisilvae]
MSSASSDRGPLIPALLTSTVTSRAAAAAASTAAGSTTALDLAHVGCGASVEVSVTCREHHEVGFEEVELMDRAD